MSRREAVRYFAALPIAAGPAASIALEAAPATLRLDAGGASFRFVKGAAGWTFDAVWVRGVKAVVPVSPADGFFVGGGAARAVEIVADTAAAKHVRFTGLGADRGASVSFRTAAGDALPRVFVELAGVAAPVCRWRTATAAADQQGAWATRGETAADAEGREVHIDGSGRLVFGHSRAGALDVAYVVQAEVSDNLHRRGKSEQRSDTFFGSARGASADGKPFGVWHLRIGAAEPKRFAVVFDRDLGGRLHDVCERYYAAAVDTQVDLGALASEHDPEAAMDLLPLRLSCPEAFVPGYGWHMEEYFPGYGKAAYPFGDDSAIQTGALLSFEGHATRRDWEKNFGKWVVDETPLWGHAAQDGRAAGGGYFVPHAGGWTRFSYHRDYDNGYPYMEGGNWSTAEHLYWTARLHGDDALRAKALGLMKHDVLVKLDLDKMFFPPCFSPKTGRLEDHRDDWNTTAGLAYCAVVSAAILHPETKDPRFLRIADRITDWLRGFWGPERRMNFLHDGVNTFHVYMGWLPRALIERFERTGDRAFLEIAQDLAWVMMLTMCTTPHKDARGRLLTGVTCCGVRGCVDYDCTPNLCHEKDQPFLEILGPLLDHVSGGAYAKALTMQRLVLPRDSWKDAFGVQEQRGLNLRTNYDNYARAMANLAFALDRGSDPKVVVYDQLVARRDLRVRTRRHVVVANGTKEDRATTVEVRFLEPGTYRVRLDGAAVGTMTHEALGRGVRVDVPANATRALVVTPANLAAVAPRAPAAGGATTHLGDLKEQAAQRGVGLPTPIFERDRTFRGNPIAFGGERHDKGLGLAANTVLVYGLTGRYTTFEALAGVPDDAAAADAPKASAHITIFVDGRCAHDSGALRAGEAPRPIRVDVRGAETLVLRVSSHWDHRGDLHNDQLALAGARLLG